MAILVDPDTTYVGRMELRSGEVLVIEVPQLMTGEDVEKLKERVREDTGADRVLILSGGATARIIGS